MENQPNDTGDFDFKKLFEEAKLDDLSNDFEKQFASIQKKAMMRKIGLYSILILVSSATGLYIYSNKKEADPTQIKSEIVENDTVSKVEEGKKTATIGSGKKVSVEISKNVERQLKKDSLPLLVPKTMNGTKENIVPTNDNGTIFPLAKEEKSVDVKPKKEEIADNKCDNLNILPSVNVLAACNTKADGKILITSVAGGQKPYKYRLDDFNYETKNHFPDLQEGTYLLQVMDANGCESKKKTIEVLKERCPEESDLVYSIARDNELKIEVEKGDQLKILDSKGNLILQEKTELDYVLFNSNSIRNQALKEGFYILFVSKTNGKNLKYEITVLP